MKDVDGTLYKTDGTIVLPDGSMIDSEGIIHFVDGSIRLADGTMFYMDGTIVTPGGLQLDESGQIVPSESAETPGSWNYDPINNNWQFQYVDSKGKKVPYVDQWINTKNTKGQSSWYAVDREGNMILGWVKAFGDFYYMSMEDGSAGEMVKGQIEINGQTYTFDKDTGALISGDKPITGFEVLGAINHVSGVDGEWRIYETGARYFVDFSRTAEGYLLETLPSKWYMIDGYYYYFDKYGCPEAGLVIFDDKYYYLESDGRMLEGGEVLIGNEIYVFDKATGACNTIRGNY